MIVFGAEDLGISSFVVFEVFLGVNIWSGLVTIPFFTCCFPLWVLGKHSGYGVPDRECFYGLAQRNRDKLGEKADRGNGKELWELGLCPGGRVFREWK